MLRIPTEHDEQVTVIQYCDVKKITVFAVPNGAHLSGGIKSRARQMNSLKAEGLRSGILDLMIPIASNGYHGMFIEMKRQEGGKVSEEQKAWIKLLNENGYRAVVCKGAKAAISEIEIYMEEKRDDK